MSTQRVIYSILITASLCRSEILSTSKNAQPTSSLPTNYGYFTSSGIESGLNADQLNFQLNGKEMYVYSGAVHYFRVPREYWRDRLRKLRAAGLNTVETYIPWNLHEPRIGEYDFGEGGNDMSDFLHIEEFLRIAQEEDLFAIVRPGPYICAEFEFAGYPSWLMGNDSVGFRNSNPIYMDYVTKWFNVLMPILAKHQFTSGGPIIMVQVENEYGWNGKHDMVYLRTLRNLMIDNGIRELLVTSDNAYLGAVGTIPDLFLMTVNFKSDATNQLDHLKWNQPNRPIMTMEYWSGWYDHWGNNHTNTSVADYNSVYEEILKYPASVNIYMFHGGTNFGFLNGAAQSEKAEFLSILTSYDYAAPLDEAGDYTDKYWSTKELLEKYNPIKTKLPSVPPTLNKTAYPTVEMDQEMILDDMLKYITPVRSSEVIPMEKLDINNGSGQSYGYIVYQKTDLTIPANAVLEIEGKTSDNFMVLVNGKLVTPVLEKSSDLHQVGTSYLNTSRIILSDRNVRGTLEIVVENWGRMNSSPDIQLKGLWRGQVKLDDEYLYDWNIYPLEFKATWTNSLSNWRDSSRDTLGPALYKGTLTINGSPQDTFVHMEKWVKGIVMINGFVLGRYARMGPIQTLYLPAPFLVEGDNTIVVFEHFEPAHGVEFTKTHIYTECY